MFSAAPIVTGKQECDFYVFTRVLNTFKEGWILGYLPKEEYFKMATLYKKGDIDPSKGLDRDWETHRNHTLVLCLERQQSIRMKGGEGC